MARRLPPLNALRAFEAAARHLSFIKAAEELHVTPGAISQQVHALEDQLGVALFRRLPRGVLLTDAGQRYGRRIAELLDGIAAATGELKRDAEPLVLTVSTMPSFAARWLIPRLGSFKCASPGITVRVLAESALTDFSSSDVDVVIRYGGGRYPGLRADLLFVEEIFPVCSPGLLNGALPLASPADLARHTLLHDEPSPGFHDLSWERWLKLRGIDGVDARKGPRFTYTHMSVQAAVLGQGVALGTSVLAADELESGRLVRPFPDRVRSEHAYWLVCPEGSAERPKIGQFRAWLLDEASRFARRAAEPGWGQSQDAASSGAGAGGRLTR